MALVEHGLRRNERLVSIVFASVACSILGSLCAAGGASAQTTAQPSFIGGTTPDRRPEGAPRVTTFKKSKTWWAQARRGIDKPYPKDLTFLDDQGAWFTPFDRPNMPSPYDLRGLYRARARSR